MQLKGNPLCCCGFRPTPGRMLQGSVDIPMQEAARGKSGPGPAFVAAAAQLQLRLMEAYLALPDAAAFATEHEALSKLCARAFRSATGAGGTSSSSFLFLSFNESVEAPLPTALLLLLAPCGIALAALPLEL